ncbi:GNAT family N-acetyltransferase [Dellaglioa sp. BT-FLS60]
MLLKRITIFSAPYSVRELTEKDTPQLLALEESQATYLQLQGKNALTTTEIKSDLTALPLSVKSDQKWSLGFFKEDKLIAMIDFLTDYPQVQTIWIGLFLVSKSAEGQGIATHLLKALFKSFKSEQFTNVQTLKYEQEIVNQKLLEKFNFIDQQPLILKNNNNLDIPAILSKLTL